ncbi:AAC(3) family N-acetyltransferase (plasmid) [Haloferacaceae archaeon DSL9]
MSSAEHYVLKQRPERTGPVEESCFDEILDPYGGADAVFVHAGLGDIKRAFDRNPYEFLLEKLEPRFESILVPGYTPSFRESGHYHKQESPPEVGSFSTQFMEDAEYRTDDAIHSILVKGPYRFDECDHHDTFAENGCFGKLHRENVRCLNVGTPWLISTQLHYIEYACDVPYVKTERNHGELCRENGDRTAITQTNYEKNKYVYYWNREKLRREMMADGVLDYYNVNGLKVMSFRFGDIHQYLAPKIERDPYYLVK